MLIDLPCSCCGRWVWLAWADYLDAVARDSPRRNWPYVCQPCRPRRSAMSEPRLSRLQRRILAWLLAEDQRTKGTMSASHQDLVRVLVALGFDKGNVSTSLKGLEAKGLVRLARTPGGRAEAVDLTAEGGIRVAALTASCD